MIEATIHQELDELSDEALDREIAQLARQAGFISGAGGEEWTRQNTDWPKNYDPHPKQKTFHAGGCRVPFSNRNDFNCLRKK